MTSKITVTTQHYFEHVFYYTGWAILISSIPIFIIMWYVGIIALALGIIMTTTTYRLVIDPSTKQIEDFMFFMGMKTNSVITPYQKLHHISIKSGTYSQQLNYKSVSSTIQGTMYSAYLFADEKNHFLGESKNKKRITAKAHKIAQAIHVDFIDL